MYEYGCVCFDNISPETVKLTEHSFAGQTCGWVVHELWKLRGQDMQPLSTYPGTTFYLNNVKNTDHPVLVDVFPTSETQVRVYCSCAKPQTCFLSPEAAVRFLAAL